MLSIITFPDSRLNSKNEDVVVFDRWLRELSRDMLVLMKERGGVGLQIPCHCNGGRCREW